MMIETENAPTPALLATPELTAARQAVRQAQEALQAREAQLSQATEQLQAVQRDVDERVQQLLVEERRVNLGLYLGFDTRPGAALAAVEALRQRYEHLMGQQHMAERQRDQAQADLTNARTTRNECATQSYAQETCPALFDRLAAALAEAKARAQDTGVHFATVSKILVDPVWKEIHAVRQAMPESILADEAEIESNNLKMFRGCLYESRN